AAGLGRRAGRGWLGLARVGPQSAAADSVLFDESGGVVADLFDCWSRRIELTRRGAPEDCALRLDLVPAPLSETAAPAILGRIGKIVAPLVDRAAGTSTRRSGHGLVLDALTTSVGLEAVLAVVDPTVPFTIAAA